MAAMVDRRQTAGPAPGTVLVSAAGTAAGYGIARAIRARWGAATRIVAADTNPPELVAASALADVAVRVPGWSDPAYAAHVAALCAEHDVATWWPIIDAEVAAAARWAAEGRLPEGVVVLAPPADAAALVLDKRELAGWLDEHGLPTPATLEGWQAPGVVVKPRRGHGSHGVVVCDSPQALDAALAAAGDDVLVQARCAPPELTIDAFRSRDGRVAGALVRERLEVKAGVAVKARVFADAELSALAARLADGLGLTGAFCFQVMAGPDGWAITDVNPRPGAGTAMSVACGFDVFAATLVDRHGGDPAPLLRTPDGERLVVRHYEEDVRTAATTADTASSPSWG
jgi:biotin carboxylase